jgi:PAS domain S-box-containing protein
MTDQVTQQHGPEEHDRIVFLDRIAELEQELKIFRQAEQISDSGNWQINLSTYEAYYSDNYYRLYGIDPGSVHPHAHTFTSFIVADDLPVVVNALEKSLLDKIPLHLEYRIIRKDGEERHVSVISNITKNSKGEMLLTGITHDITEKKNLELELSASIEKIRLQNELSSHAEQIGNLGLWQLNLYTRQVFFSENFLKVWGLKNFTAVRFDDLSVVIHPDDLQLFEEIRKKIFEETNALDVEFRIIRQGDGKTRNIKLKSKLVKNYEGNVLHVGLIQDVTDIRDMQCRLNKLNEQLLLQNLSFAQAEHSSGMGSWTWNQSTDQTTYSANLYNIFGVKPDTTNAPPHFLPQVHPDDRQFAKEMSEQMRTKDEEQDFGFRVVRPDGKIRHFRARNRTITGAGGERILIGSTQDITDEVVMQQQLKERINFAEMLSDTMADMIIVTDRNHHIISCNKSCGVRYKNEKQSFINRHFFEIASEWKHTIVPENLKKALSGEHAYSHQVQSDNGEYFDIFHVPLRNELQQVIGALSVFHDITHAVQMKQEVQQRLEFIEKLMEGSVDRIAATDANLRFILWNSKCENYYGLSKEQVIGKHMLEIFPGMIRDPVYQGFKKAIKGETAHIPAVASLTEGNDYYESYLSPIRNQEGKVSGILWVVHDLSREMQLQLQQKKESDIRNALQSMLKEAEKLAHLGSWELHLPEGRMTWSDEVFRIYGYQPQSFDPALQFYYSTTHKNDRKKLKQAIEDAAETELTTELLCRIYAVHGTVRFVNTRIHSEYQQETQSMRIIGTMQDITEQKELKDEYEKQNQSMLLQHQVMLHNEKIKGIGSWQLNSANRRMVWGENLFRLFGLAPHSIQPSLDDFVKIVHPDDQEYVHRIIHGMMEKPEVTVPEFEFRVNTKGKQRIVRFTARHVFGEQVTAFFGTVMDVTCEAQLKNELQQVITISNLLMDSSEDRICAIDSEKHLIAWNASWEKHTGRKKAEVIGLDIINIIPDLKDDTELSIAISNGLQGMQSEIIRQEAHWVIIPLKIEQEITGLLVHIRELPVTKGGKYSSAGNVQQ